MLFKILLSIKKTCEGVVRVQGLLLVDCLIRSSSGDRTRNFHLFSLTRLSVSLFLSQCYIQSGGVSQVTGECRQLPRGRDTLQIHFYF